VRGARVGEWWRVSGLRGETMELGRAGIVVLCRNNYYLGLLAREFII
jgi:hypothetical protein